MRQTAGRHRKLRFEKITDLTAELDRILAAERAGTLRTNGQWSPGQILGHLASWINYAYVGYPMRRPPWPIRMILRWKVSKYLRDGMPTGVRIPRTKDGTFGIEPMGLAEGDKRLREALERLSRREPAKYESPAFGPMSLDQRIQLTLRHAELHLGFLA